MKHEYKTNSQRTAEKLLRGQPKGKPIGRLINGHFHVGKMSLHRTKQSRTLQLFWRIKFRKTGGVNA
jgi:hypothetical protein